MERRIRDPDRCKREFPKWDHNDTDHRGIWYRHVHLRGLSDCDNCGH